MAENHHPARWRPWRSPILALLVVTVLFHWRLVLSNEFTWMESPDIANQVLPWFQHQVGEWQQGRMPLWDPFVWGGQPLIGQAQPGAAYPLNWLLFWMPTHHGFLSQSSLHWYFVLIHFLGAFTAYRLALGIGCRTPAALAGGIFCGLGGYVGSIDWPQMLNGAVWAPLVLLYILRASASPRPLFPAAVAGAWLGFSMLSGHHQVPMYAGVAGAAIWLYLILHRGKPDWTMVRCAALFFVMAALTSAFQSLPAWEYSRNAVRWIGFHEPVGHDDAVPYTIHERYSLPPHSVLGVLVPGLYEHVSPYTGVTVLTLAAIGVALGWSSRAVRILTITGLASFLFALGGNFFLHGILYSLLPVLNKARSPGMALALFHLSMAMLAATGIDQALRHGPGPWTRHATRILAWGAISVWAVFLLAFLGLQGKIGLSTFFVINALCALLLAGALRAWSGQHISGPALALVCVGLTLTEITPPTAALSANRLNETRSRWLAHLAKNSEIARVAATDPGNHRVRFLQDADLPNLGDWLGMETAASYLASTTRNVHRFPPWTPAAMEMWGVRYVVSDRPFEQWSKLVAETKDGARVFENPNALPRAWSVHVAEGGWLQDRWRAAMEKDTFDFRQRAALVGQAPSLEQCQAPDFVKLLRRRSDYVSVWTEMACRGLVIVSDTFYPGWTATVDGRPAKILEVNGSLRGVVVDAGVHRLEMRFRPGSVYAGAAASALGGAIMLLWWRRERRITPRP